MEPESPRETTQKLKFARPAPPKKPVKEKPTTTMTAVKEEPPAAEVVSSPEPSTTQRPTPPIKPSKEKESTPSEKTESVQQTVQQQTSVEDEAKGPPRPSPVRRQRPQPPVKPRTSTMASTGSAASGDAGVLVTAAPTGAQVAESALQPPPPQQQQRPVPAKRPVPRKRTVTPQNSPSREAAPPVMATNKEPAAPPKDEGVKPSAVVKEPTVPAKPQAPKEPVVSVKEAKPEPEIEEIKPVAAVKEEAIVPEKEVKPPPAKEPEILDKKDESVIKEPVIPETEPKPEVPTVLEKEEKELEEGKIEVAAVSVEIAVEKPKEKEEKLPPTPFDDIEETDIKAAEPKGVNQWDQLEVEGGSAKNETETVEEQDDSSYVYEDMESGEKSEPQEKKDAEYEIMNFDGADGEEKKESTVAATTVEEAAADRPQQRQAPGKVHQYDQVALDESPEPKFKISSSSSKDFDPTLSSSSGYEHMEPAPAVRVANKEREPSLDGEYVPMKDGVIIEQEPGEQEREVVVTGQTSADKYEYEEPCDWVEKAPPIIRDTSPPYDSLMATPLTPSPGHNRQDELALDADVRRSVTSSTGSVSSQKSSLEVKGGGSVVSDGEERRRGSSSASKKSDEGSAHMQPDRDSLGVKLFYGGGGGGGRLR